MSYTKDWFSWNVEVWEQVVLPLLPERRIRWLEIGSLEGRSAVWTLENVLRAGDELVCVDPWADKENEKRFDDNVKGRATKVVATSEQFLLRDRSQFDCIYIDGSHDAPTVFTDAALCWLRLKVGGVMIFDDYEWRHPRGVAGKVPPGPAIDGFLASFATKMQLLHKGWQVIIRKRSQ